MDDPTQPGPAQEIEDAIRNAINRVPAVVIVGLLVIAGVTLGLFSTRKR